MTTLLLVRHGQADHNLSYTLNDNDNPASKLTFRGKAQSAETAKQLEKYNPDILYSSDLERTRQTADIIGKHLNLKKNVDRRLNEFISGYHNQKGYKWILRLGFSRHRLKAKFGSGESLIDARDRVEDFINDAAKKHKGKTICVVAHLHTIQAADSIVNGVKYTRALRKQYGNATIHEYQI